MKIADEMKASTCTALLWGGFSREKGVSQKSAKAVAKAFETLGIHYEAIEIGRSDLASHLERGSFDRAFIIAHGGMGENGALQALLERVGLRYTGSGTAASMLAMDKVLSKSLWRARGIKTAPFCVLSAHGSLEVDFSGPYFAKPISEGSSFGIQRFESKQELLNFKPIEPLIVEPLMAGPEYTVAILNDKTLPSILIRPPGATYDFHAKYVSSETAFHCPSGLSPEKEQEISELAFNASSCLGVRGWSRVDIMVDAAGEFNVLEVNTVPGMTDHSLVPMAAKAAGISFELLVKNIWETA